MFRVIILVMCALGISRLPEIAGITTKVVKGVYFEEIPKAILYERNIPLRFQVELPGDFSGHFRFEKECNEGDCKIEKIQNEVFGEITTVIRGEEENGIPRNENGSLRYKREVEEDEGLGLTFIGRFGHFCCGIETEKRATRLIAEETKSRKEDEKERSIAVNTAEFGVEIEKLKNAVARNTFAVHYALLSTKWAEVRSQCINGHLPEFVVSRSRLQHDLQKLKTTLERHHFRLAISDDDLSTYYVLPLTTCEYEEHEVTISLKVPIVKAKSSWKLAEVTLVPFTTNNQICYINLDSIYVAISGNSLVPINNHKHCQPFKDKMCLVPENYNHPSVSNECIKLLLQGSYDEKLKTACRYHCFQDEGKTKIFKVTYDHYILINPSEEVQIKCKDERTTIPPLNSEGAYEIFIGCTCKVTTENATLLDQQFPCPSATVDRVKIHQVFPFAYTNISNIVVSHTTQFENPKLIRNDNWKTNVEVYQPQKISVEPLPSFTFHKPEEVEPESSPIFLSIFNFSLFSFIWKIIITAWLAIITYKVLCCPIPIVGIQTAAASDEATNAGDAQDGDGLPIAFIIITFISAIIIIRKFFNSHITSWKNKIMIKCSTAKSEKSLDLIWEILSGKRKNKSTQTTQERDQGTRRTWRPWSPPGTFTMRPTRTELHLKRTDWRVKRMLRTTKCAWRTCSGHRAGLSINPYSGMPTYALGRGVCEEAMDVTQLNMMRKEYANTFSKKVWLLGEAGCWMGDPQNENRTRQTLLREAYEIYDQIQHSNTRESWVNTPETIRLRHHALHIGERRLIPVQYNSNSGILKMSRGDTNRRATTYFKEITEQEARWEEEEAVVRRHEERRQYFRAGHGLRLFLRRFERPEAEEEGTDSDSQDEGFNEAAEQEQQGDEQ